MPCTFQLVANRYFAGSVTEQVVVARGETMLRLPLVASGRWYDFSVKVKGQADFSRRFAGRVETGAPSVPARARPIRPPGRRSNARHAGRQCASTPGLAVTRSMPTCAGPTKNCNAGTA